MATSEVAASEQLLGAHPYPRDDVLFLWGLRNFLQEMWTATFSDNGSAGKKQGSCLTVHEGSCFQGETMVSTLLDDLTYATLFS